MCKFWKKTALTLGVTGGLTFQACTVDVRQAVAEAAVAGLAAAVEGAVNALLTDALPPDDE